MVKSIEEQVEDLCKRQLNSVKYYTKIEKVNTKFLCTWENKLK